MRHACYRPQVDDLHHLATSAGAPLADDAAPLHVVLSELRDWLAGRAAAGSMRETGFECAAETLQGQTAVDAFASTGLTGEHEDG